MKWIDGFDKTREKGMNNDINIHKGEGTLYGNHGWHGCRACKFVCGLSYLIYKSLST